MEVQAPSGGYPFYGELITEPPGLWYAFRSSRQALVDPALLVQLDGRRVDVYRAAGEPAELGQHLGGEGCLYRTAPAQHDDGAYSALPEGLERRRKRVTAVVLRTMESSQRR